MEIVGGMLVALVALTVLAAVGVTTLVAFALMAVLGFVTEMSFRRTFFVSFLIALLAPIFLAIAGGIAIEDGALDDLNQSVTISNQNGEDWVEVIPRFEELRDRHDSGELSDAEFEAELEALIEETTGAQIEFDDGTAINVDVPVENMPVEIERR